MPQCLHTLLGLVMLCCGWHLLLGWSDESERASPPPGSNVIVCSPGSDVCDGGLWFEGEAG